MLSSTRLCQMSRHAVLARRTLSCINLPRHISVTQRQNNDVMTSKSRILQHTNHDVMKSTVFNRQNHQEPNRKTTALTVISDLKHLKTTPAPALTLGLGGLIPFVAVPAYMILTNDYISDSLAFCQLAYGASILSFLGGVRWGITLPHGSTIPPDWRNLLYSVSPSLVAWVGLLLPYPTSTFTVMSGLCGCAYFDLTMAGYPPWFKALRFLLTFVAVLSLWTTVTVKFLMDNGKGGKTQKGSSDIKKDSESETQSESK